MVATHKQSGSSPVGREQREQAVGLGEGERAKLISAIRSRRVDPLAALREEWKAVQAKPYAEQERFLKDQSRGLRLLGSVAVAGKLRALRRLHRRLIRVSVSEPLTRSVWHYGERYFARTPCACESCRGVKLWPGVYVYASGISHECAINGTDFADELNGEKGDAPFMAHWETVDGRARAADRMSREQRWREQLYAVATPDDKRKVDALGADDVWQLLQQTTYALERYREVCHG